MSDANAKVETSKGPSPATLSRARWKLDILNMYVRRWEWCQTGFGQHHIVLGCLSKIIHALARIHQQMVPVPVCFLLNE